LEDHKGIPKKKLVPVVHLRAEDKRWGFGDDDAARLLDQVASNHESQIIALTERELGLGILDRTSRVRRLKEALKDGGETKLHILGCGNPLTFGLLAGAGADLCDGLEWCRTCCAPDMRLYHFHQRDIMPTNHEWFNTLARYTFEDSDKYDIKTFVWNLDHFARFGAMIQGTERAQITARVELEFGLRDAA
jgi:hypothetical protein